MTGIDGLLTVCSALLIVRAIDLKRKKKICMGKRMANARDTRYDKNVACDKLDENRMKIVPCVIPSDCCRMELDGIELNQGSGSVLV